MPCFTIKGGFQHWINKLSDDVRDHILLNSIVSEVTRVKVDNENKVLVKSSSGIELFDHVVLCAGAKMCNIMLQNKNRLEQYCLSAIRYDPCQSHVHSDESFIPKIDNLRNYH